MWWVRSKTWRDERPVATGLDRFFSVFRFFDKRRNWQPKKFRICATATSGPVFCSWVQFDFGLFSSPANWTCKHYVNCSVARQGRGPWCWLLVGPQHMARGHVRIGSGLPKFVQTGGSSFKNTQFLFRQCFFHVVVTSGILKTTAARKRRWNITEPLGAVLNAIFRYTYYNILIKGQ